MALKDEQELDENFNFFTIYAIILRIFIVFKHANAYTEYLQF